MILHAVMSASPNTHGLCEWMIWTDQHWPAVAEGRQMVRRHSMGSPVHWPSQFRLFRSAPGQIKLSKRLILWRVPNIKHGHYSKIYDNVSCTIKMCQKHSRTPPVGGCLRPLMPKKDQETPENVALHQCVTSCPRYWDLMFAISQWWDSPSLVLDDAAAVRQKCIHHIW